MLIQDARDKRGIQRIELHEIETFNKTIAEAQERLKLPDAPATPLVSAAFLCKSAAKEAEQAKRQQQDKVSNAGCVSHN